MNTITIHVEFGPESRAILGKILAAVENSRPNCQSCMEQVVSATVDLAEAAAAAAPATETATPDTGHPVDEVEPYGEPEPVAAPEPEPAPVKEPKWTKADLTAKVQQLAAPGTGMREKVRDIVKSYAEKVGDIPADKYNEVMDKLAALEKED